MTSTVAAPEAPEQPVELSAETAGKMGAFTYRNFRLLWLGLFLSNAGTWMSMTAEGWLVTDLEPDRAAFWLGAIAAAFAIPMIILPPFGGVVADRFTRMRILWVTQSGFLLLSLTISALSLTHHLGVWGLVAISAGMGIVLAFDSPARQSMLPDLVPPIALTSAVSLNSVAFTGASLVGPAVAGLLIPLTGVSGVFVCRALLSVCTLVALRMMTGVPANRSLGKKQGVWSSIASGVSFLWSDPLLRGLMALTLATGMFGRSYSPLLAVYARDEFDVGSGLFGLLIAAGGLGTLAGALTLSIRGSIDGKGRLILIAAIVQAFCLAGLAITQFFFATIPLQVVIGAMGAVTGALIATLLQMGTPQELRGRVMSLYVMTLVGAPSMGALFAGVVADATSVRGTIFGCAALLLISATLIGLRIPQVREAS